MRQASVFVALSALGLAAAQSSNNFTVDPNTVDPTTRTDWCNAEFNTCGILCGGKTKANSCTPNDLKFVCTCTNGSAPGLEYYIQSMPTLLCEQSFKDCIAKTVGNAQEQGKCKTEIMEKCGTLDPAKAQVGGGSSSPSSSSSGAAPTGSTSGTANAAPSSTTSVAGAVPTMVGNGFAAVAVGVFAAALL